MNKNIKFNYNLILSFIFLFFIESSFLMDKIKNDDSKNDEERLIEKELEIIEEKVISINTESDFFKEYFSKNSINIYIEKIKEEENFKKNKKDSNDYCCDWNNIFIKKYISN